MSTSRSTLTFIAIVAWSQRPAAGATDQTVTTGTQVLVEDDSVLKSWESLCGNVIESNVESATATSYLADSCDIVIDRRGVIHIATLIDRDWSDDRLTSAELERRQADDLSFLPSLGFDASEFGSVHTKEFAVQDRDEDSGEIRGRRILGTKTFVDRDIAGVPVLSNRAVVTRDANGQVARITAAWPALAPEIVLHISDSIETDDDDAADLAYRALLEVRPVVILGAAIDGVIADALVCSEVTQLINGPEGSTAPSSFYVLDGRVFNPRE